MWVQTVYNDCIIKVNDVQMTVDLILLDLTEFDLILGKDWLAKHRAKVDCYTKEVILKPMGQSKVIFYRERKLVPNCLVSAMQAFRMIRNGCEAYLAHVVDIKMTVHTVTGMPVVEHFSDVFPDVLSGLPPDRETEFTIEILPGTTPISIPSYRMT
ncbi:hypothetical protein J0J30_22645, partial [Vibrio vulnificus]|nr:hypothetical protein [Vibrio vulnificus]